jgi:magnesium-transporting ATPase (P-type)
MGVAMGKEGTDVAREASDVSSEKRFGKIDFYYGS